LEELQEEVSCTDFKCEQAAAGGESVSEFSVASFFVVIDEYLLSCGKSKPDQTLREAGWKIFFVKSSGTDSGEEE